MPTLAEFDLLRTRFFTELEPAAQRIFGNSLCLSLSQERVHIANRTGLLDAAKPVLRIFARIPAASAPTESTTTKPRVSPTMYG